MADFCRNLTPLVEKSCSFFAEPPVRVGSDSEGDRTIITGFNSFDSSGVTVLGGGGELRGGDLTVGLVLDTASIFFGVGLRVTRLMSTFVSTSPVILFLLSVGVFDLGLDDRLSSEVSEDLPGEVGREFLGVYSALFVKLLSSLLLYSAELHLTEVEEKDFENSSLLDLLLEEYLEYDELSLLSDQIRSAGVVRVKADIVLELPSTLEDEETRLKEESELESCFRGDVESDETRLTGEVDLSDSCLTGFCCSSGFL